MLSLICAAALAGSVAVVPGSADEVCRPRESRRLFRDFVAAYNRGDLSRLDFIFRTGRDFATYRVFPERPMGQDRSNLMAYFQERIEYNDVLEIQGFKAGSERSPDGSCGISFRLERESDDPWPWGSGTFSGKGGMRPEKSRYMWAINMSWSP